MYTDAVECSRVDAGFGWHVGFAFQVCTRFEMAGDLTITNFRIRIGGANGSELQLAECPSGSYNKACQAASLLLHVTSTASGYFENIWV